MLMWDIVPNKVVIGNIFWSKVYIQCESKNPPCDFLIFFPNGWKFLINFYTHITRSFLH